MSRKILFLTIFVVILNLASFNFIYRDFRNNTFYILASDTSGYNINNVENDVAYINENYEFWKLKTETNKLKYDLIFKAIWTLDFILLASLYLSNRKK